MVAPAPFATDKLIRFHHRDPAGIVFFPQYFVLFNELVEDWFARELGVDFARLHGVAQPLTNAAVYSQFGLASPLLPPAPGPRPADAGLGDPPWYRGGCCRKE